VSLVAGCSLLNGVLLAADTRITWMWPDGRVEHADVAQKLYVVAPGTAIGFVSNDIALTSMVLREILRQAPTRRRHDGLSLSWWMPKLLRRGYQAWPQRRRTSPDIAFMVASVLPWQRNLVRRVDCLAVMKEALSGTGHRVTSFSPLVLAIGAAGANVAYALIPHSRRGLLYVMRSPHFRPRRCWPLQFAANGTGAGVATRLQDYRSVIVGSAYGEVERDISFQAHMFLESIHRFAREQNIETVGGLYPRFLVDGTLPPPHVRGLGFGTTIPFPDGARIQLTHDGRNWIQENVTAGQAIRLVAPWEVDAARNAGVFDDLEDAYRQRERP
jgi:hypothetical protein